MKIKNSSVEPIPWAKPAIDDAELQAVIGCMKSGWLTSGPRVAKFETGMAYRAKRKYAVAVSNGTAALDLALRTIGLDIGDEVIVPAFSYVATASAVAMQRAIPVFVDIDARNFCIDPDLADAAITPRTRAILCTDYGGNPCDFTALTEIANRHQLPLILDGAQSIGTMFGSKPSLAYGLISTVSFHAAKTMTTIEGGMAFTDDESIAQKMRTIRSQGEDPHRKYHHIELGHNFRMTELQAAIGIAQLGKLDALLESRRLLAARYREQFSASGLRMPNELPSAENGNFLFSLLMPARDGVMARLKQRGIETRACYPIPLYEQPIFTQYKNGSCPITEEICANIINPPMFFGMTISQQHRVVSELLSASQELSRHAA